MSLPLGSGETVTILSEEVTGQDAYGNDVTSPTRTEYPGCPVWPRGSTENIDARDTVITGLATILPPNAVVKPTDRAEVRGRVYEIEGEAEDWGPSPLTGTDLGFQLALRRVTG